MKSNIGAVEWLVDADMHCLVITHLHFEEVVDSIHQLFTKILTKRYKKIFKKIFKKDIQKDKQKDMQKRKNITTKILLRKIFENKYKER